MSFDIRQHKTFLLLLAAQASCLATGLWLQQQFLDAHGHWYAERAVSASAAEQPAHEAAGRIVIQVAAFVWILGIQSVAAWLLLGRLKGNQERLQLRSQEEAMRTTRELLMTRDAVVFGLAKLAESRDPDTGMHLERIALYSTRIASALRKHRRYRDVVSANFVNTIGISSALHDIGKVGVEDAILLKPGRLTHAEHFRIQSHTQLGAECIRQIERRLGNSNFLEMAREITLYHHERWDGAGYPTGLSGEEIPLAARIVAIADVYDALRVKRVYKEAKPHDECVRMIREEAGRHFDPALVEVFLSIEHQLREISERFADHHELAAPRPSRADQARCDLPRMTPEQARLVTDVLEAAAPVFTFVTPDLAATDARTA